MHFTLYLVFLENTSINKNFRQNCFLIYSDLETCYVFCAIKPLRTFYFRYLDFWTVQKCFYYIKVCKIHVPHLTCPHSSLNQRKDLIQDISCLCPGNQGLLYWWLCLSDTQNSMPGWLEEEEKVSVTQKVFLMLRQNTEQELECSREFCIARTNWPYFSDKVVCGSEKGEAEGLQNSGNYFPKE